MSEFVERLRAFEQKCQQHLSEINCPVHLCFGQEKASESLSKLLNKEDWVFSTHRSHGHYFAKGGGEDRLWDEIMGLESGVNGGFCGSQCFTDPSINFHASAIVGGLIGVATGTALAIKGTGAVVVCCVGDGATEEGIFWESLNYAALKTLPIMFLCENNGYSVHTSIHERQARDIGLRVSAFGIPVFPDVEAGFRLAKRGLPSFVEIKCIRECPHVRDMDDYRPSH